MESEDSRDGSSENESNDEGGHSPISNKSQGEYSTKSNASSRSSSESRVQSALSQHSQNTTNVQENEIQSPDQILNTSLDNINSSDDSHNSIDGKLEENYNVPDSPEQDKISCAANEKHLDYQKTTNTEETDYPKEPECSRSSPINGNCSPSSQYSMHSKHDEQLNKSNDLSRSRSYSRSSSSSHKSRSRSSSLSESLSVDDDRGTVGQNRKQSRSPTTDEHLSKTTLERTYNSSDNELSPVKYSKKTPLRSKREKSHDDNESVKSDSSTSSKSASSSGSHASSGDSRSRGSRKSSRSRKKSQSSVSSHSSKHSRDKQAVHMSTNTHAEEISDGDMESDHENDDSRFKEENNKPEINISHEDLSDVSDLEESMSANMDNDEKNNGDVSQVEHREHENVSPAAKQIILKNKGTEEGEEQLDFEAEDGECAEIDQAKEKDDNEQKSNNVDDEMEKLEEKKEAKELEEGEVTDEDDVRPEETEPRPVCRFFSRGQCTWGASCRFLHPGVTDKGNYTMFELIRPMVPGEFRDERIYGKPEPPLIESAWERGLRTAKEMLRKSVKRKEQDIDFEEKKMNLSLAQEEFDKENGYYGRVPSPEPRYVRHIQAEYPMARAPPEDYYGRRQMLYEPEYAPLPVRERVRPYRELPTHRMPDYYNAKYEEEPPSTSKRPKPKREVIVQRVEERQGAGRGDEWSDPWMRSKSPAGRRKGSRKRSYSSGSSYSSTSSSRSSSDSSRSTYRSKSRSPSRRRRSRSRRSRHVSPSVIVSERKAANERAALMNPPAPKRRAPSPGMMRVTGAANPPAPSRDELRSSRSKLAAALARVKGRKSSRSSSGSSGSSSSDTDSSDSSSSSSRDESSPRRPAGVELSLAKAMDALKSGGLEKNKIKLNLKNPVGIKKGDFTDSRKLDQVQGKKRTASSPPGDPKSKKATSRREELLKQLKAVEDAIAKKRSKVI